VEGRELKAGAKDFSTSEDPHLATTQADAFDE